MNKYHHLKCWVSYFRKILDGEKTFELRYNDREYKVGDILILEEYDEKNETYTGRITHRRIAYILDSAVGLQPGFAIMSIRPVSGCSK